MNNKTKGFIVLGISFLALITIFGFLSIYKVISGSTFLIILGVLTLIGIGILAWIIIQNNKLINAKPEEQKILSAIECEAEIIKFMKRERLVRFNSSPEISTFVNEGEGTTKNPIFRYRNREYGTNIWWDVILRADDIRRISALKNKDENTVIKVILKMSDSYLNVDETITRKTIDAFGTPQLETVERKARQNPQALEQLKQIAEKKADDMGA